MTEEDIKTYPRSKKRNNAKSRKKSRNARAPVFGWIFQSSAGLYLLLDCIENAISLKMEGKTEDIEITLEDKSIIYAQAKSVENPNDTKNVKSKLKLALTSLSECVDPINKLIYVTNIPNPLESEHPKHYEYSRTSYNSFFEEDKQLILDLLNKNGKANFPTAKFEIVNFKFFGEEDSQRYSEILNKTREFLNKAKVPREQAEAILTEWKAQLMNNNAQRTNLSKADILFPLILVTIERQDLSGRYNDVCNLGIYDETISRYSEFIHNTPRRTDFFLQVCGLYQKQYPQGGDNINDFVIKNWQKFIDEFSSLEKDNNMLESLIKLLLLATLLKRYTISGIKAAAKLP